MRLSTIPDMQLEAGSNVAETLTNRRDFCRLCGTKSCQYFESDVEFVGLRSHEFNSGMREMRHEKLELL